MVKDGITTLAERFDYHSAEHPNGHYSSLNHQFMCMVDGWFFRYVAGIQLDGFGWDTLVISPCAVDGITEFKATVRNLSVSLSNGVYSIDSSIPFTLAYNGKRESFEAGKYSFNK
jgi:hypothetical protein